MKNAKFFLFVFGLLSSGLIYAQEPAYKAMLHDPQVNFYDACRAAEAYFDTVDKHAKGSGWKGYMRWRANNEFKYYPDGNRANVDPYLVSKAYQNILQTQRPKGNTAQRLFNSGWKDLGPYTIDSLTGHYSAGLGRIEDFYVHPSNPNIIYQGSRSGGFWRSSNGGASWIGGVSDTLFASGCNAITASPTNADSVLINVRNARNGYTHGIYRSTNGGQNFVLSNFNPTNLGLGGLGSNFAINEIAYHPRVPNLIFIATNQGIFRSDNNLATWTRLYNGFNFREIAFHPTNDNIIYLYTSGNIANVMISTDGGLNYGLSSFISGNTSSFAELTTTPQCPDCIYFASTSGVWKSTNQGQTWSFLFNPNQSCGGFAVSDTDSSKMIYGYVDIMGSTNGGQSWNQITYWALGSTNGPVSGNQGKYTTSTNYVHADLRNAKCINGVFYVGTDGFLCKSTNNGTSWERIGDGVGTRENYCVGVSQSNYFRSMSGSQDNGTSIHTENGWVEFYGADGMEAVIHPLNDDYMIGSVQYGTRRRTLDGGLTQNSATPSGSSQADWIAPLAINPNDQFQVYDFRNQIYRSDDFAETYTVIGSPASFTSNIDKAEISESNPDVIVVSQSSNIDKSTNGGVTFTSIKGNLPNYFIEGIAIDPKDEDVIVVVYGRYQADNSKVYITTNGGTSWTNITHNLGSMPIRSVVIDHTPARNIYLGAEIGVYTMPIGGNNWALYNPGFPNVASRELDIVYGSNTLRAAVWGRGLWEYSLVGRLDYPAITRTTITDPPSYNRPRFGEDQYVTSKIHYTDTLSQVWTEWSVGAPTFGNVLAMTNVSDTTWVTNAPIPTQPVGSKIYFKVFAVGSNMDTTETYKFMYEVRPYGYCYATGNTNNGNLYLNDVSIDQYNFNSLNTGYSLTPSPIIRLDAGGTYTLDMMSNTSWSGNDFSAWIDYNNDAEFTNDEEIVMDLNTNNDGSGTFTIPPGAVLHDTLRMRCRLSFYTGDALPCGNFLGEVEDYYVMVRSAPNFSMNLGVDSVCAGDPIAYSYVGSGIDSVSWTFSSGGNVQTANDSTGSISLSNGGTYDVQLIAYVGADTFQLNSPGAIAVGVSYNLSQNAAVCSGDSYTFPDGSTQSNITAPVTYTSQLSSAFGCDSIITTTLAVGQVNSGTDVLTACGSLTWIDGNTYTSNTNAPTFTLTNASGCDSVVTLNLTVLANTSGTDVLSACDSLTWIDGNTYTASTNAPTFTLPNSNGCDSVVTLNLTINSSSLTVDTYDACGPITWIDGNTYSTSNNTATYTYTSSTGCDSVIQLALTITNINATVSQAGVQLVAQSPLPTPGLSYQWIDCSTNQAIPGETNGTFEPSASGSYAVVMDYGFCTDTSACITYTEVGTTAPLPDQANLFPNPNTGKFTLDLGTRFKEAAIKVYDDRGRLVYMAQQEGQGQMVFDMDLATGNYFMQLEEGSHMEVLRFVVEE